MTALSRLTIPTIRSHQVSVVIASASFGFGGRLDSGALRFPATAAASADDCLWRQRSPTQSPERTT
jgi:hypothetical protein